MRCGACGNNESFTVFKNTVTKYLIIECNECKSTSKITVSIPKLLIEWGENSDGILAIF
jgi:uncharacterized Zn finger protein